MMSETPNFLVSIIVPVYNREQLIKTTLESVISQSYTNWECIVVDDGSNDDTWTVLQGYSKRDNRIKILARKKEPKGAPTCRNIGISASKGDYVIFLDSDDLLGEECLQVRTQKAQAHPDQSALIFDTSIFREILYDDERMWNDLSTDEDDLSRFLKGDPVWSISGPFWKNKDLGRFDETAIAAQDWEFHVRFLLTSKDYLKITPSPKNSQLFCRRNDKLNTITTRKKSNEEFARISQLTLDVISETLDSPAPSKAKKVAIYTLLKQAIHQKQRGFKKVAGETWKIAKKSKEISKSEYSLWRLYIALYNKSTKKVLEFLAYRIFKKADVLNANNSMLK